MEIAAESDSPIGRRDVRREHDREQQREHAPHHSAAVFDDVSRDPVAGRRRLAPRRRAATTRTSPTRTRRAVREQVVVGGNAPPRLHVELPLPPISRAAARGGIGLQTLTLRRTASALARQNVAPQALERRHARRRLAPREMRVVRVVRSCQLLMFDASAAVAS